MAQQTNNTMQEQLPKLRKIISDMKVVAESEADLEWLINLETEVLMKEREPMDQAQQNMQQQGLTSAPVLPPGSMGQLGPGVPTPGPMGPPPGAAGMGGLRATPQMPGGDELRRLIDAPPSATQ